MDSQGRETNVLYSSPPYVDPLVILDGNYSINPNQLPIQHKTQLDYSSDHFKKIVKILITLFLILVLLFFFIYQIVLGCYNCGFESTNLGWIRASFILNIPFLLGVLIYIIITLKQKKMPSFSHVIVFVWVYISFFSWYTYSLGIFPEVHEFSEIRSALNNATIVNSLPCPTSYYHQVCVMKIIIWCLPSFFLFNICVSCFKKPPTSKRDNEYSKYDRFVFVIVRRWTDLKNIIFSRHREETFIERF